jgi:hypothetical protein
MLFELVKPPVDIVEPPVDRCEAIAEFADDRFDLCNPLLHLRRPRRRHRNIVLRHAPVQSGVQMAIGQIPKAFRSSPSNVRMN